MKTAVANVILVMLVNGIVAHDFAVDCQEHCQLCRDEQADSCDKNALLLLDGDLCRCCDQCGRIINIEERCKDEVQLRKVGDQVVAKVVPVKCQHGYECLNEICVKSETGFCSIYMDGLPHTYTCDNNGQFLPIECSNYHCWCINPFTGSPMGYNKVSRPMNSENVSFCYYLMTVNGVLDLILPGSKHHFGMNTKSLNNQEPNLNVLFPESMLRGLSTTKITTTTEAAAAPIIKKKHSSKSTSRNNKPVKKGAEKEDKEINVTKTPIDVEDEEVLYRMMNNTVIAPDHIMSPNNTSSKKRREMKMPNIPIKSIQNETHV